MFQLRYGLQNHPRGVLKTLYSFGGGSDGNEPFAGLVLGTNGNFFGTTRGSALGTGTVFEITSGGTLTTLSSAGWASASLVQAVNRNFYGTTQFGGDHGDGTVFEITPSGTLTTLHSFDGTGGAYVLTAALVQAANGILYGTTEAGGASKNCQQGCGTVFSISPGGRTFATLHSFDGTDGSQVEAGLVLAANGNFYGTTKLGGASTNCGSLGCGTIFEITPGGMLTTLHSFDSTDGAYPEAPLVQATDGNFYGTTQEGGNSGCPGGVTCGTVFEITPEGTLTTLHKFDATDGQSPLAALLQATDGNFYGTTYGANNLGCGHPTCGGTVFKLSVGLGPFVTTVPTSGNVGRRVIILGTNLTGTTGVTFNGTAAAFTVVSATEITTTVPTGATTGAVQVTTPSGPLSSNVVFGVP
jgi:uncharacterized repeat protein (TIGR03803 family)